MLRLARRLALFAGVLAAAPFLFAATTTTDTRMVIDNAHLVGLPTYQYRMVLRLGVNQPGDADPEWFTSSSTPCAIAGGDIGSQVVSLADAGCFNVVATSDGLDIRNFGAQDIGIGNVTGIDSTPALTAALAWCGGQYGRVVRLGAGRFAATTADLSVPRGCELRAATAFNGLAAGASTTTIATTGGAILHDTSHTIQLVGTLRNVSVFAYGLAPPTSVQDYAQKIAGFAGNGITVSGDTVKIYDSLMIGFNQCVYDTGFQRPTFQHLGIDCTNGINLDNVHDVGHLYDIHGWEWLGGPAAYNYVKQTISAVADNGSGLIRLTVASTADFQTGNILQIRQVDGFLGANGNWPVTVVGDGVHLDLQGSNSAGVSIPVTLGAYANVVQVSSLQGLWAGMTVSGANIAAGTTIMTLDWTSNQVWLSNYSTNASSASETLTFGNPGSYSSGNGYAVLNNETRNGTFIHVTNSEQINYTDVFEFGWHVGYNPDTGTKWQMFVNAGCDQEPDPTITCFLVSGNANLSSWIGGQGGGASTAYADLGTLYTSNQMQSVQVRTNPTTTLFTGPAIIVNTAGSAAISGIDTGNVGGAAYILGYPGSAGYTLQGFISGPMKLAYAFGGSALMAGQSVPAAPLAGLWTPQPAFGALPPAGNAGMTYTTTPAGRFRIDPYGVMTVSFNWQWSALGTASGAAWMAGLPLNCAAFNYNYGGGNVIKASGMTATSNAPYFVSQTGNSNVAALWAWNGSSASVGLTNANFTASAAATGQFSCATR